MNKHNYKVLFVEDEPVTRLMMTRFLNHYFTEVYSAENGDEGFKFFSKNNPDIIITDLSMPILNGFKMLDKIRETNPNIPVVVTTAYRDLAHEINNAEFVFKPINNQELFSKIKKLLEIY